MSSATSSAGRLSAPSPLTEPPRSLTTTFAPSLARRSASPRPTPWPAPVSNFAEAVTDESPIFQDPRAAKAAGHPGIPAPPTFNFAMQHWGLFPELQPPDKVEGNPMFEVIGKLMEKGGLVLHGEQEF